jgi:DNA mismatch repair ATPase MutS
MVIVTSHDIDLANQLRDIFDFYYFTETVNDTGMQFDYKIRKGLSTERNAVKLLSMLDFPKEIISKTK